MNMSVVILAAGLGTRMRSKRAKVLHRAGGLTLVEHVVSAATAVAPPERITTVTGHQAEEVEAVLEPHGIGFVRQVGRLCVVRGRESRHGQNTASTRRRGAFNGGGRSRPCRAGGRARSRSRLPGARRGS